VSCLLSLKWYNHLSSKTPTRPRTGYATPLHVEKPASIAFQPGSSAPPKPAPFVLIYSYHLQHVRRLVGALGTRQQLSLRFQLCIPILAASRLRIPHRYYARMLITENQFWIAQNVVSDMNSNMRLFYPVNALPRITIADTL
jgi:hypothetical protein